MTIPVTSLLYLGLGLWLIIKIRTRLLLSKAKHPSLHGHAKISRLIARHVPYIEYDNQRFFSSDGAPASIADQRRAAFSNLASRLQRLSPRSINMSEELETDISDVLFTNTYRVPFPYRRYVKNHIKLGTLVTASHGNQLEDLDGNLSYDLSGSYGVNIFGYEFYKECLQKGYERAASLGPVLGPYHPVIKDNVTRLKQISGLDEVSFHMSGTEAVMQAVRMARYHTGKKYLVRFCGSYHGWWDGVQPGIGNNRKTSDVYTLKDMDKNTLRVLRTRRDIACILINPLQALHPNANAPGDAALLASDRKAVYEREAYADWLQQLRQVCSKRGIVMIMDEVFLGFRLAQGGAQEYFSVQADMVTYGKGLGGGLPVGVLCGKHDLMKRFKDDRPTDISFARGTFNSHPYVMTSMNAFLNRLDEEDIQHVYQQADSIWTQRVNGINELLLQERLPIRIANLASVWMVTYTLPSRYNWMYQFYLRTEGLSLSWVGTGRFIFPHNLPDEDYAEIQARIIYAARKMQADGWWWQAQGLTNKSIKRAFMKELIRQKLRLTSNSAPGEKTPAFSTAQSRRQGNQGQGV
jgi:glutamate-1-semialdehyde 2,1-aminomutase